MKAKEAPEKIYILNHKDYSDRRRLNAFTEREDNSDIEYTRTDAFIEKACKWLKENKDHPFIGCEDPCLSGYLMDGFIEAFKKAMEK